MSALFTFTCVYVTLELIKCFTSISYISYKNNPLADLEGGYGDCNPHFQISKIEESIKQSKKIEVNPPEKEEERKGFMFV